MSVTGLRVGFHVLGSDLPHVPPEEGNRRFLDQTTSRVDRANVGRKTNKKQEAIQKVGLLLQV